MSSYSTVCVRKARAWFFGLYLQIEAPVKHKHYRLAVSSRKLCILKGVFPREPKKKVKGNHHTYYHLKDVSFIQHEPLLERLREIRAYERKVKKADEKKNKERAAFLKERRPTYKLDRIILQRFSYREKVRVAIENNVKRFVTG
ncbi:pescadillo-like protein [Pyrus ussuriensis x Pyrus communis]|uniref:Pescadillo-like protein n=1 Tax=Pyrus ussuriensis x Pyrus communis TaxID=2448454 RepID=A0A5N5H6H5_9ROSA|nr:pescadillo-like protein [Pyrus ussuriensis x Pyrus communis]